MSLNLNDAAMAGNVEEVLIRLNMGEDVNQKCYPRSVNGQALVPPKPHIRIGQEFTNCLETFNSQHFKDLLLPLGLFIDISGSGNNLFRVLCCKI